MVEEADSKGGKTADVADAAPAPGGDAELGADLLELALPELTRRVQKTPPPPPIQNPTLLPLGLLDPEVLERVVAEIVSRQDHRGVQFYGRRGQKQYGLDVVERCKNRQRSLYQVKGYQQLTGEKIRDAVKEYAGSPRKPDTLLEPRRFNPSRFVVVTSAEFDRDTGNVNTLASLQEEYAGDLDIEVWGAEALSRKLRDMPPLVWAVFGPDWAKAFCGFERQSNEPVGPRPLGLVEAPVAVLGLDSLERDAAARENTDAASAARLYGLVADELDKGGFPGHATEMRRRQARVARAGGNSAAAFELLFDLALNRVLAGDDVQFRSLRHDLEEMMSDVAPDLQAKLAVLASIADWDEQGSDLDATVPGLRRLAAGEDPHWGLLCCLVLEQALVDGLYDFAPIRSVMATVGPGTARWLADLRELARASDHADVVRRTRLRCAVADAELTAQSSAEEVDIAYGAIVSDASAGRLRHARGLALSRAARAFVTRGEPERAENLWRQSILTSSEDRFYGDARGAMRALRRLEWESDRIVPGLNVAVSALPDRRRLLAAAQDPVVAALESIHNGRLADALGAVRRYLWESRLAGHLCDEQVAGTLLGDVLAAGKYPAQAVETYVAAGAAKKAAELARQLREPIDVVAWTRPEARAQRAAAAQVIGAQAATFPDDQVGSIVDILLLMASGLWESPFVNPDPELDALKAIARFGIRIPEAAIDRILEISEPALVNHTAASAEVADLLVQVYWAVQCRRDHLAAALARMLRLSSPPYNLWGLIRNIPNEGRGPLLQTVRDLADQGQHDAVSTLAHWNDASEAVQLAARRACATLLRRPIGVERDSMLIETQAGTTVELLVTLLEADSLVVVAPSELGPDKAHPAGGVLLALSHVANVGGTPQLAKPSRGKEDDIATEDAAARTAAGPPAEVAVAVAHHLMAMTEDHLDGAAARAQATGALRLLLPKVPHIAAQLAIRLQAVHDDPRLSADDLFELESDTPLSSGIRTGGGQLAGLALLAAAEAFQVSHSASGEVTTNERDLVNRIAASAAAFLRDDDREARVLGALTVRTVATTAPEFQPLLSALLYHTDERVRAHGAAVALVTRPLFTILASDPSPMVRQAVASRARDLPAEIRQQLAADTHLGVRRTAGNALGDS